MFLLIHASSSLELLVFVSVAVETRRSKQMFGKILILDQIKRKNVFD